MSLRPFFSQKKRYLNVFIAGIWLLLILNNILYAKTTVTTAPATGPVVTPLAAINIDPAAMPDNIPKPLKIGVSLILNNLINLDEQQGTFEADVDLTLTWNNPNLSFDPKTAGTTEMNFNEQETTPKLKTIWWPEVTISNIEKIINDIPSLAISPDGTVVYVQRIKAAFKIHPDLRSFPFDSQSLTFFLDASKNTTNEVQFFQDQQQINHSGVRAGVGLTGWTMQGIDFKHSLVRNQTGGFYPRFEAKISMKRIAMPHLFAFAPLFLIILSPTILTLFGETSLGASLTAWGASLLTLIATMFALNQKYPALEANSILPQITSIILGYQFVMIFLSMTFLNPPFARRFKNPYVVPEIVRYLRWAVPAALILLVVSRILLAGKS
ncbi:MAG: hypothetical protein PSV35_07480 [bacterium]|nr:hypothetical protein [bacterium]